MAVAMVKPTINATSSSATSRAQKIREPTRIRRVPWRARQLDLKRGLATSGGHDSRRSDRSPCDRQLRARRGKLEATVHIAPNMSTSRLIFGHESAPLLQTLGAKAIQCSFNTSDVDVVRTGGRPLAPLRRMLTDRVKLFAAFETSF